jgi:integrase
VRTVQRLVRRTAREAGLPPAVTATTLRRGYIVQCLRDGANVRAVQDAVGHRHLATTLDYRRYLLPPRPAGSLPLPSSFPPPSSVVCLTGLQPGGP